MEMPGDIHSENPLELPIGEEMAQEFALITTGIDDAGCSDAAQDRENCAPSDGRA